MRHSLATSAAVISLCLLTGCGAAKLPTSPTAASTRSTPPASQSAASTSPAGGSAAATGLFAVLEDHNPQDSRDNDEVVIVGPDGHARARASFTPRPSGAPAVCDAATWLMPEAYVADGAVYFADAAGVVRRLQPDGTVTMVTSLPFDARHQVLSFIVSPDGQQIMATIFTIAAPVPNGAPGCGAPSNAWVLDTYHVSVGAAPVRVNHVTGMPAYPGSSGGFQNVLLVGWDGGGPIAAVGPDYGTQDTVYQGQIVADGQLSRFDTSGNVVSVLGGDGCSPFSAPVAGSVICTQVATDEISVRQLDGGVRWHTTRVPGDYPILGSIRWTGRSWPRSTNSSNSAAARAGRFQLISIRSGGSTPQPSLGALTTHPAALRSSRRETSTP